MEADDIMVLEVDGEGKYAEHYLIGRVRQRQQPYPPETPLWLDVVDNDQDRSTAFEKARKLAAGRDVFFTQRGRPSFLQDHYNSIACPKCGIYSRGLEQLAFGNGAQSVRCPACKHALEITIKEP
jgi:ribosomal protein S27E